MSEYKTAVRIEYTKGPTEPEPPGANWSAIFFMLIWTTFGLLIVHHTLN